MTIRNIVSKSPGSLQPCAEVVNVKDKYVQQAIQDLLDTLEHKQSVFDVEHPKKGRGVGLAANQIEYPYEPTSEDDPTPKEGFYPKDFVAPNIYVVSIRQARADLEEHCIAVKSTVFINSTFTPDGDIKNDMTYGDEGCLSINGIMGLRVPRYRFGTVSAHNKEGEGIELRVGDFHARVHQHESDHCKGQEFLDRMAFTLDDFKKMREWIRRARGGTRDYMILDKKLFCSDVGGADAEAFSVWVEDKMAKMLSEGRFGEGIDLSLLGGEQPQEVPKPKAADSATQSFVN